MVGVMWIPDTLRVPGGAAGVRVTITARTQANQNRRIAKIGLDARPRFFLYAPSGQVAAASSEAFGEAGSGLSRGLLDRRT